MLETVYVTIHAIVRWRERVSAYTEYVEQEILDALKASSKVRNDEFLPMPRRPHTHYYYHKEHNAYFVVEPINLTSGRLISVIIPELPDTPVLVTKSKNLQLLKKSELFDNELFDMHKDPVQEYERCAALRLEIENKLREVTKGQIIRKQLVFKLNQVIEKLSKLKSQLKGQIKGLKRKIRKNAENNNSSS